MRVTHNLWKVSNGWILVPEGCDTTLSTLMAPQAVVFTSLSDFAKWKPKRVRKSRALKTAKPGQTESEK